MKHKKYSQAQGQQIMRLAYECVENQRALAKAIGSTQQTVSAVMQGRVAGSDALIERAREFFGDDAELLKQIST